MVQVSLIMSVNTKPQHAFSLKYGEISRINEFANSRGKIPHCRNYWKI